MRFVCDVNRRADEQFTFGENFMKDIFKKDMNVLKNGLWKFLSRDKNIFILKKVNNSFLLL